MEYSEGMPLMKEPCKTCGGSGNELLKVTKEDGEVIMNTIPCPDCSQPKERSETDKIGMRRIVRDHELEEAVGMLIDHKFCVSKAEGRRVYHQLKCSKPDKREAIEFVYSADIKSVVDNPAKVKVFLWIDPDCSFEEKEYEIQIASECFTLSHSDYIEEAIEEYLIDAFKGAEIPKEKCIEVSLIESGEYEPDVFSFNRYYEITEVKIIPDSIVDGEDLIGYKPAYNAKCEEVEALSKAVNDLIEERDDYREEVEHLKELFVHNNPDRIIEEYKIQNKRFITEVKKVRKENTILREALEMVAKWKDAYPEEVFSPIENQQYYDMCEYWGYAVDRVSAHVLRPIIKAYSEMAIKALSKIKGGE